MELTPLNIYKITPKTNCGKCLLPSCLAFGAAVVAGQKSFSACWYLRPEDIALFAGATGGKGEEEVLPEFLERLAKTVTGLDFPEIAPVLGCSVNLAGELVVSSLGKDFRVDSLGNLHSQCHVISWVQAPILSYITKAEHSGLQGAWLSFRELKGGIEWQGLFTKRCEEPLRVIADNNPEFLRDLIDLFKGEEVEWYQADIALALKPLPHIAILICYQEADNDLDSELTIFFDECCGVNLNIKAIYALVAGLVKMFEQIAESHYT